MRLIGTATVWVLVIVLLAALAACGFTYAEEAVNNPSAAGEVYTDYHLHIQSKPMAEVFIAVNGSDTFGSNRVGEFSAETARAPCRPRC